MRRPQPVGHIPSLVFLVAFILVLLAIPVIWGEW